MKEKEDYIRDIAEMRNMMERSTRFMSLSGLAGVMAGIYALAGAFIAYKFLGFDPGINTSDNISSAGIEQNLLKVIILAMVVLVLAVGTAILLSSRKAERSGERSWNPTSRRMVINMAVPLVAGGLLILIAIFKGLTAWVAPFSLIFYGLALFNASKFTYEEVRSLGLIQVVLGLAGAYFTGFALLFWGLGFGIVHIIYGIYMHYRYER
jgi:hypothetical protein